MSGKVNGSVAREGGFSLVELLVVVVIVSILSAVAVPLFTSQRARSFQATARADGNAIAKEIASMLSGATNMGTTPATATTWATLATATGVITLAPGVGAVGVNLTSTGRVTSGTTITTSGMTGGAITGAGPTWCVAFDNNGQKAVYTAAGLQQTATACSAAGAAS